MNKIRFLLVEDDPSAAIIAQAALEEGWAQRGIEAEVVCRANGFDALEYLQHVELLPDLIITDIKMPRLDGTKLIGLLKASTLFKAVPIIVLSTSDDEDDKRRAYMGGCAGYFVKSTDYDKFMTDLQVITDYWTLSRLPDASP